MKWQTDTSIQTYIDIARDTGEVLPKEALPPYVPRWQMECVEFFQTVSTQWLVGFSGLVGLNYLAVTEMAKVYEFDLTPANMEIIRFIERFYIERSNHGKR